MIRMHQSVIGDLLLVILLDEHSSLVVNNLNLSTGYISPQYHLVFDDLFKTVMRQGYSDTTVDAICNNFLILIGMGMTKRSMILA